MKKPWKLPLYILCGLAAIWLTLKILLPVGLPFLLGLLLACLAKRPARWLESKGKLPARLSAFLTVTLIALALGIALWFFGRFLFSQLQGLAARLPQLLPVITEALHSLQTRLLHLAQRLPEGLSSAAVSWIEALFQESSLVMDTVSQWLIGLVGGLLSRLPHLFLFLLTMLLSAYLLSAQLPKLRRLAAKHIPAAWRQRVQVIRRKLKSALGGYCKAQFYLILVAWGIVLLGLFLLRRPNALLLACLIALVDALPVFGAGTVLIPWALFSFVREESALALGLLLLYGAVAVARAFLEPRFLGRQIGLNPLLTLISLYGGYQLFGLPGMILVPIGVMLIKQLYDLFETA